MTDLLKFALQYLERDLSPIPVAGKIPLVERWQQQRLDESTLQYWFTEYQPGPKQTAVSGIGIVSGKMSAGGLCVLDFDGDGWREGFDGFIECWGDLLSNAPLVETGKQRRHIWTLTPDMPDNFTNKKFQRNDCIIELRGNRSQSLCPPSTHPDTGQPYRWLTSESELIQIDFAELLSWLTNWSEKAKPASGKQLKLKSNGEYAPLPRRTLEFVSNGAPEGERNVELYEASKQFRASGRPLETAINELKPVALEIGLDEKEIEPTIKSGYKNAEEKGFTPIQPGKPGHDILRDRWLSCQPPTAYGLGDWRQYHNGLWAAVPELEIKASITKVIEAAKVEGIKVTSAIVSSVSELTKFKVARPDSIWDSNSNYLVCQNGTLCIPDRVLGEHNPALYATSGVSFGYDPTATAPAWEAFLFDLATGTNQKVVNFLQEFAGYALTVDTSHELSIWLYGPPGSGKSTFLAGLEAMLGNRAGLLGLADIVSNRFALANLPGKTLAISTEQPGDYIASTHILNALISGESITVDIKFKPAIQITPRCKLAWAMNELPRVSDPNSGLFRRVKVVEFPVIPESDRNPELKETIKTEGAGILNWALAGLARLRNRGRFEIPPEVREATESFKANNDIPARFVEDCCLTGTDQNNDPYRVSGSQLYDAYKTWCATTGHKPQSSTSIATDCKRLGFEKYIAAGKNFWRFVGLKV